MTIVTGWVSIGQFPIRKEAQTSKVYNSWELVAQTLSERGCRLKEDILPIQSRGDYLSLEGSGGHSLTERKKKLGESPYLKDALPKTRRSVKSRSYCGALLRLAGMAIPEDQRSLQQVDREGNSAQRQSLLE
jgi:hypothetical protein